MKAGKIYFLITLFFFLLSNIANAQINTLALQNLTNVNVDDISDDDIEAYYQKAQQNGISQEYLVKILAEKGMSSIEIAKLIERINNVKGTPTYNKSTTQTPSKVQKIERYTDNKYDNSQLEKVEADISIFGAELFTTKSKVFEPDLRIPTPTGYILGPDDELVINVFGLSEKTYNLTVNEEGNIYIPQIGPLFLNGLSIELATSKIKSKMASTIYKAIKSGQTRVQITLGKIRSIRVTVIGQAKKPGTYTVSSLTTLFNLLYLCGGPTNTGSYRKIEIIRGNEVKKIADLYAFLVKGNQKDNILLQEGDVVRIPYYITRVFLDGNVKKEGIFELIEGETFSKLLEYCGGFTDEAYKASITVFQLTDKEKRIVDVTKEGYNNFLPQSSDRILIGKIQNSYENKLSIAGAVLRPGEYALTSGLTLKQLIEKAGGVKEDVYSKRGSISRLNTNKTPIQLSFDIDSILKGLVQIELKKYDSITIYSIFDLINETSVYIDGMVKKPGKYKWAENLTLNDIILAAGGLTESGDFNNIEIARRIQNVDITKANHLQTEIINVNIYTDSVMKEVQLKPYDVINIRQLPGFTYKRTVFVEGMVKNPGRYTLKMSGDKISDIIKRAGGFRANADTSAVVIKRVSKKIQTEEERQQVFSKLLNIKKDSLNESESIKNEIYKDYDKISIDLGIALQNPLAEDNMILEDGDVISIERNTNLVKVSGEVYFPTIIPYKKNASLKYYIQKSGSFTQLARKSGTLVIYPDGKAKKVKHFLFFKKYPKLVSRAEIYVPQKANNNKSKISIGELSVLLSTLAIIANVIVNLKK